MWKRMIQYIEIDHLSFSGVSQNGNKLSERRLGVDCRGDY